MGILSRIKRQYDRGKVEKDNAKELGKIEVMFRNFEDLIQKVESIGPDLVVKTGQTKMIFKTMGDVIPALEDSIYKTAVACFCSTLQNNRKMNIILATNEEWNQIEPLLEKYEKIVDMQTNERCILKAEYEDFKDELKQFSKKYPQWFSDGTTMVDLQNKIEKAVGLEQMESRFIEGKKRVTKYWKKINVEESFLTETNFSIMDPFEFENYIANLFWDMGYEAQVTPPSKDMGVDVIAAKDGNKIAIQVKKYAEGHNIGNEAVQRLLGAMQQKALKADKGILITTSDFTEYAKLQAEETPVEL